MFEMNITPLKETTREKVERVFQEYKLVLETQMHFNDMLMKYRSLAFTVKKKCHLRLLILLLSFSILFLLLLVLECWSISAA
ncbi:hypothetical protein CEE36_09110 [candidate division TA06 bacterium B3_TA06]|uniref:Uncharacterized protein n=1 Tax=candidate division TA06 bacterium B3_TA06 TaxID=2012487 RepID=A0A532V198_UNCT6|nr:MAG: hypothetical protein CEE36_09110 [candidate division TA06 bacterium B3_TA06]